MKIFSVVIACFLLSCGNRSNGYSASKINADTVVVRDTVYMNRNETNDWQQGFGLTHDAEKDTIWNRPASYYLNDADCAPIAFEFYHGYFRPTDDGATTELLKYASTDNEKLRPFYRWCLDKTMEIADGALWELLGVPARKYVEKFPAEFFTFVDRDTSGERYHNWVEAISYSGFYNDDDWKNPRRTRKEFADAVKKNLHSRDDKILKRVEELAMACFPDGEK